MTTKQQPRRLKGEGSVRQRREDQWEARYRDANGKTHSIYRRTQREAVDALRDALKDAADGRPVLDNRLKVGAFLDQWLGEVQRSRAPRTHDSYRETVDRYIRPSIGNVALAKLTPGDVARMVRDLEARTDPRPLSPTTVRYTLAVLRIALGRATRLGKVQRNVASLATPPRPVERKVEGMTPETAVAIQAAVKGRSIEPLVRVALATGLRQGELLALRWRDVDLVSGVVTVRGSLDRRSRQVATLKTAASRRTVRLDPVTVATLTRLRAGQTRPLDDDLDWVFRSRVDTPLEQRNVTREWHAALTAAKLPTMPWHQLRHGFATLLLARGVDLAVISKSLGHADITTTSNTYLHLTEGMQQSVADAIGAALAPAAGGSSGG